MTGKIAHPLPNKAQNADVVFRDEAPIEIEAAEHRFAFYPAGADRFAALIEMIEQAQHSLYIFYYLFQADDSGHKVRDALMDAAGRGVDVHLIVDAFGSDAPASFFDPLRDAGARFDQFLPRWNARYLIRNHQKYCIADRAKVMTGGFNVSDHYFAAPQENGWCDLGVLIEGTVVDQFCQWYENICDWLNAGGSQFRRIREMVEEWEPGDGAGNDTVRLLLGGPGFRTSQWLREVKHDLAKADRADFVTAYFSPQNSVRRALSKVARRGTVRLVLPGKSDLDSMIAAARQLYGRLLRNGTHIREFQPCKLHMKLIVIDNVTYIGSANLDRRSSRINLEMMVRIDDPQVAKSMRGLVDHLEQSSIKVTPEWYRKKATFFRRVEWLIAYTMTSVDYWVSRRLNLE